jgi:hypothetical protein
MLASILRRATELKTDPGMKAIMDAEVEKRTKDKLALAKKENEYRLDDIQKQLDRYQKCNDAFEKASGLNLSLNRYSYDWDFTKLGTLVKQIIEWKPDKQSEAALAAAQQAAGILERAKDGLNKHIEALKTLYAAHKPQQTNQNG